MSQMFRESLQDDGRQDGAWEAIREKPKLAKFTGGDNIEAFLTTFENGYECNWRGSMVLHIGPTVRRESPTSLRSHGREPSWIIRIGEEEDFTEVWSGPRVLQAEVLCCKERSRRITPGLSIEN